MALFVDGPVSTIDDLRDQDSGLLDAAAACGINVTTKIRLAHDEMETELEQWLSRPRATLEMVWRPTVRVGQIVATAPLKRWGAMLALTLVYRDAYFSQLVDRYQAKWNEYSVLSRNAYETFLASGLGLVNDPIGRAGLPILASVPGPQTGGTFYASVAWVNAAGQEGEASVASSIAVSDGNLMTVSAPAAPANAVGFNVYAGAALNMLYRQNNVSMPIGGIFTYVPGVSATAQLPGSGQVPDYTRQLARTILRG